MKPAQITIFQSGHLRIRRLNHLGVNDIFKVRLDFPSQVLAAAEPADQEDGRHLAGALAVDFVHLDGDKVQDLADHRVEDFFQLCAGDGEDPAGHVVLGVVLEGGRDWEIYMMR
jgi:hypothetical protein